jgi:hypothetical protein
MSCSGPSQALAYLYSRARQAKVVTKDEARPAINVARLSELLEKADSD